MTAFRIVLRFLYELKICQMLESTGDISRAHLITTLTFAVFITKRCIVFKLLEGGVKVTQIKVTYLLCVNNCNVLFSDFSVEFL